MIMKQIIIKKIKIIKKKMKKIIKIKKKTNI